MDSPTFKEAKEALLDEWEGNYLRNLLDRARGNMTLAAQRAGIARAHLYRLTKKHHLSPARGAALLARSQSEGRPSLTE